MKRKPWASFNSTMKVKKELEPTRKINIELDQA